MYSNKTNIKFYVIENLFNLLKYEKIENITIKKISELSNISRTSFYNNFKNINSVIEYKIDLLVKDIYDIYLLNKFRKRSLDNLVKDFFEFLDKNKDVFLVIKENFFFEFKNNLDSYFIKNIENSINYYKISGTIINLSLAYLENKINKKDI